MPSLSYNGCRVTRASAIDEMHQAHAAVGGTARGRRYATQQINRALAILLSSQFQGFCRDLHSESVDHILAVIVPAANLSNLVRAEFTRGRQLDRGNVQPSSLGADFGRLGLDFWDETIAFNPTATSWKSDLELLNEWRNAIAHQDFTSPKLGGITILRVAQVRAWRVSCDRLALVMDEVLRRHLLGLTGASPW
jgi:hypothetical protein